MNDKESWRDVQSALTSNAIDMDIVVAATNLVAKRRALEAASSAKIKADVEMREAREALGELLFAHDCDIAHPEDSDAHAKIEAFAQGVTAMLGTLALNEDKGEGE